MNTLSIVASFGALVWIFQDGNLSSLLGFQPLGFVETTQPVILFCVLFGLSMDYEVFLLSRMKEVWDRTGDKREAVARGLERSGRIVTSAALIVVLVAGSFAFADIVLIKALGIGMAIAVALDATVVRALLVPATMRLLGRWNWWMPACAGTVRRRSPAGVRGRGRGRGPMSGTACVGWPPSPLVAWAWPPARRAARRSWPTRRRPRHPPRHRRAPVAVADPLAVACPRDDGPHDRLTEWWYYTGHLRDRRRRALRLRVRDLPRRARRASRSWASHLALTDETGERVPRMASGSRSVRRWTARRATRRRAARLRPLDDGRRPVATRRRPAAAAWAMPASAARTSCARRSPPTRRPRPARPAASALDLALAATKPPALHDDDGWIDFGPAGGSYYYSRTAMTATGTLTLDGSVAGGRRATAWFDHQWGDFISVGGGGWDWFAVNLDDGTDLTLSLVRDADGSYPLVYGTRRRRRRDGPAPRPRTRSRSRSRTAGPARRPAPTYPAGWTVTIPGEDLDDRAHADGRGPGAGHAGDDGRRLLGGVAGGRGDAQRASRWAARRTWS